MKVSNEFNTLDPMGESFSRNQIAKKPALAAGFFLVLHGIPGNAAKRRAVLTQP